MAQFEQWFAQDFTEKIEIRHCESVMFTGDDKGAVVGVHLFNGGTPYSGGGTVSGKVIRSDGAEVALTGTISGNSVSVVLLESCLAVPGPIGVYIRLTASSQKTTVLSAIYTVQATSTGTIVDPGTIISSVNDLIDDIQEAVASIPADYSALLAAVAPTFSTATAYSAGSYVWYNGALYRFITAHTAGTWTGNDAIIASIDDAFQMTAQVTQNIWLWGNRHANKSIDYIRHVNIPAGTYTLSAVATTDAISNKNSRIQFFRTNTLAAAYKVGEMYIAADGARHSQTFEIAEPGCVMICVLPGLGQTNTQDVYWYDIQLEAGTKATPYVTPITAKDMIARTPPNQIDQFIGTFTGPTEISVDIEPNKITPNPVIFSFDAKYTQQNTGDTKPYPYFFAAITTDRGLVRNIARMKIGEEDSYRYREFRSVPYIWDNRTIKAVINVPAGVELTIKNACIKQNYILPTTEGLQFHAHDGDCGIAPSESLSAVKAAIAAGFNSFIVIPKISSDGVWFAYHDDTFDISTTILRNPDGSTISSDDPIASQYQGKTFDQIPWTYLSTLRNGNYGAQFADERLMKLEDFFFLCAKTGLTPMFSMHPRDGVQPPFVSPNVLGSLKSMMQKHNVLKKSIIKMPLVRDDNVYTLSNFTNIFSVFGNDVARYEVDAVNGMENPSSVIQLFDAVSGQCTVPKTIEWWLPQHYADPTLAAQAIAAGYDVSSAQGVNHTDPGGYTVSYFSSEDIVKLANMGVTEFTVTHFIHNGLMW